MSKTIKIILIVSILFFLNFNISFATSDEENINEIQDTETVSTTDSTSETTNSVTSSHTSNYGVTSVNRINSYSEANLELNNILNIILIAIGTLIILFAIAILIRLKHTN